MAELAMQGTGVSCTKRVHREYMIAGNANHHYMAGYKDNLVSSVYRQRGLVYLFRLAYIATVLSQIIGSGYHPTQYSPYTLRLEVGQRRNLSKFKPQSAVLFLWPDFQPARVVVILLADIST